MVQGGLLTAHPGGVHGCGLSPGGGSSSWQGAGAASPGSPDLETAAAVVQRRVRDSQINIRRFPPRGLNIGGGGSRGPTSQSGGSLARPRVGPRQLPSWLAGGGPPSLSWFFGKLPDTDFLSDFSGFFGALLIAGKPEIQK